MKIIDFPNTLGGVNFEKLINYMRERKPFFFDKTFSCTYLILKEYFSKSPSLEMFPINFSISTLLSDFTVYFNSNS